jgi:hypothetical protein
MANTYLSENEVIYLKDAIIHKYCENVKQDVIGFRKSLTGTLKHYEFIAEVINNYLEDEKYIYAYVDRIAESQIKITLKKWLDGNNRQRNFADRPSVTSNILRKLIFDQHTEKEIAFKEFFVLGCYIFTGIDKTDPPIRPVEPPIAPFTGGTIPPVYFKKPIINKAAKFTLKTYENGTVTGSNLKFAYNGSSVVLNRANLDPENHTITSKIQAKITFENGNWSIENCSEFNTTHLQVIRPTQIKKGDIIVFGNQAFLFED